MQLKESSCSKRSFSFTAPDLNNLKGTFRVRLHLLSGFEGERLIEFKSKTM